MLMETQQARRSRLSMEREEQRGGTRAQVLTAGRRRGRGRGGLPLPAGVIGPIEPFAGVAGVGRRGNVLVTLKSL
jgi:hypothetical protein